MLALVFLEQRDLFAPLRASLGGNFVSVFARASGI